MKLRSSDAAKCFSLLVRMDKFAQATLKDAMKDEIFVFGDQLEAQMHILNRRAWQKDPLFIDTFIANHRLTAEEIEIVEKWKNCKPQKYLILHCRPEYTIFADANNNMHGVLGLQQSIISMLDENPPTEVETCLLAYKKQIFYDGMIHTSGMRMSMEKIEEAQELYKAARKAGTIITQF